MTRRIRDEDEGFTLIELLVVILIIGILAAIALPTFLGQQKKGQDASAKSDARNLVSHVEACFSDNQDYTLCNTKAEVGTTGLNMVDTAPNAGEVGVTATTATTFTIGAKSKSGTTFYVKRLGTGGYTRSCDVVDGGCKTGNTW